MAHHCNEFSDVQLATKWEANGIEVDIAKGQDGIMYAWHGTDNSWTELNQYLDAVRQHLQADTNGQKVCLYIFDLKYDAPSGYGNGVVTVHRPNVALSVSDITDIRQRVRDRLLTPSNQGVSHPRGLYAFYNVYEGANRADAFVQSMSALPLDIREGVSYDAGSMTAASYVDQTLRWKDRHNIIHFFF